MPDRIVAGTWAFAAAHDPRGHRRSATAEPGTWSIALDKLDRGRRRRRAPARRLPGAVDRRPRAVDVVDAALPRLPDRPAADGARAQRGRRGRRAWSPRTCSRPGSCSSTSSSGSAPTSASTATTPWCGAAAAVRRPVEASDIRAGAALVIAGLVADGVTTVVAGALHVDRGYAGFDAALRGLGAEVTRARMPDPAYA